MDSHLFNTSPPDKGEEFTDQEIGNEASRTVASVFSLLLRRKRNLALQAENSSHSSLPHRLRFFANGDNKQKRLIRLPLPKQARDFWNSRNKKAKIAIIITPFLLIFLWLYWDIPLPTNLTGKNYPVSTLLFDRNGKLIYEIYSDKRRSPVKIDELPDHVKQATIAIEDKDFYKHHGISVTGMIRAARNIVLKQKLQGGSTLTQQLVKNVLLTPERTIRRKIREITLTFMVELLYSKDQILEMYLNQIPYGSTAYGIESAADLYFGKDAKDLTLAEASLLAGLLASPTRYSPFGARPETAKNRQALVLNRMVEDGYITQEEADQAKQEELEFAQPEGLRAPHFALLVKDQLVEEYGERLVEQGGLRVTTTLDLDLQEEAQQIVANEVEKLSNLNVGNGAALVTRPGSGEVLAMVGSKDYFAEDEDGKVNVLLRERQPGSSIKPLNYALAMLDGKITPSTVLADVPTCFSTPGQPLYCPKNYDGSFHGGTQVRFALGNSYNIPAVRVLALNGLENFIAFARALGIKTFKDSSNYGLSLTLGGGEVRPIDMAVAFGTFANGGVKKDLITILKVEDWQGNVLEQINPEAIEGERILDSEVPFLISHILLDNNARSAAFGTRSFLRVPGHDEVSVKTGTTNDLRDNWTIGYTSHILALSWVGNNDNTPMSGAVSGVSGASPIWNKIIKIALDKAEDGFYNPNDKGHAWPQIPEGIQGVSVCTDSGLLAIQNESGEYNCHTRFEYFLRDALPDPAEGVRQGIPIDKTTGALSDPGTPPENIEIQEHPFLYDPLSTPVCLDCPTPRQAITVKYPL